MFIQFFTETWRQIRLLSVEPVAFLAMFMFMFKRSPIEQLIQDKLCLQKYHLPANYCIHLPTMTHEEDTEGVKSAILSEVTRFDLFVNLGFTIPVLFISLQIGPFIDRYVPAKRLLLIYSSVIFFIEGLLHLVNVYFFWLDYRLIAVSQLVMAFSAGPLMALTVCWSYVTCVTPTAKRSIRMTILEIFVASASPIAMALSGNLLGLHPLLVGRESRNYSSIFLIQLVCSVVYLIIALLRVDEDKERQKYRNFYPELFNESIEAVQSQTSTESWWKILLNIRANLSQMYSTVARKRLHGIRMQIILLLLAKAVNQLANFGPNSFLYQYVQRVFAWNTREYSNYTTAGFLINIASTFIAAPVLMNRLKMPDMYYSLIGNNLLLATNILRLASTSLTVFYTSLAFNVLNTLGGVGIQVYISKIMDVDELGRIFSIISVLDAAIPLVSSVMFSTVFRATINTAPNLSFLAVSVALVIGIACSGVVAIKSRRTLECLKNDRIEKADVEENKI